MEMALELASYPYRISVPSRYTDVDASGAIGHLGLSRYHEDVRTAFVRELIKGHRSDSKQWRAFLGRARTEVFGHGRYPQPLSFGAGVCSVGERSYGIEVSTFQGGVQLARARSLSVAVDANHKAMPVTEETRGILSTARLASDEWSFSSKPSADSQKLESYPHRCELTTRFTDTDAMGHLNNVALLRYCEEGRAALFVSVQPDNPQLGTVLQVDISFLQEGRFLQVILIGTSVRRVEGSQVHLAQGLFQEDRCVAICDCVVRVPQDMARRLSVL
jgi:acyl-CoA thioester hydrolase